MLKSEIVEARHKLAEEIISYLTPSVPPIDMDVYREFVADSLVATRNTELYCLLGLFSELGELDQVLCKSLRPSYSIGKTISNFWSELSDVVYWLTALSINGFDTPDLDMYPWSSLLTDDLLPVVAQINYDKLKERERSTGSITK